jgi:hypothetical protein
MRRNSAADGRRADVVTDTPGRLASALLAISAALRPDRFDDAAERRLRVLLFGLRRRGVGERNIVPVDRLGEPVFVLRRGDERPLTNGSDRIWANVGRPVFTPPAFKRNVLTCVEFMPRYPSGSIRSRNALVSGRPVLISSRIEFKKKCRSYLYDDIGVMPTFR